MRLLNKQSISIWLVLLVVLAAAVSMAWSPVLLRLAKYNAARKFADCQDEDVEAFNQVLASEIRRIQPEVSGPDTSGQERLASVVDGYRFSFPALKYTRLPGDYVDFDSEKLTIRCLGTVFLAEEFAKAVPIGSPNHDYFSKTDPFLILVDVFNASPKDIERQSSFDDLNKHLTLLLIKSVLMPVGADKHWERIDTGTREGIIVGDTSLQYIIVTLYLQETREFADVVIWPKEAATMADVYGAIAELEVSKADSQ